MTLFTFANRMRRNPSVKRRKAKQADETLRAEIRKQKARIFKSGLILSNAWLASSYWTYRGLSLTSQETATASFRGSIETLLAAIVSAVVVAGCCAMLLGFAGSGGANE